MSFREDTNESGEGSHLSRNDRGERDAQALAALNSGSTDQSLLQLVTRYQAAGLAPQKSYEILEEIWTEYGFDKKDDGDRLRQSWNTSWRKCGIKAISMPARN